MLLIDFAGLGYANYLRQPRDGLPFLSQARSRQNTPTVSNRRILA
jgi:hypothetical protein